MISTIPNKSILATYLFDGTLWVKVDLGVMAMKRIPHTPQIFKTIASTHQELLNVIPKTPLFGGGLSPLQRIQSAAPTGQSSCLFHYQKFLVLEKVQLSDDHIKYMKLLLMKPTWGSEKAISFRLCMYVRERE